MKRIELTVYTTEANGIKAFMDYIGNRCLVASTAFDEARQLNAFTFYYIVNQDDTETLDNWKSKATQAGLIL